MSNARALVQSVLDIYQAVRSKFPDISAAADRLHEERWGDTLDVGAEYAWFEALADALNEEMRKEVPYINHAPLFQLLAGSFAAGSPPVRKCIDVSFVENLFSSVPSVKCEPYWKQLPDQLSRLYMEFHYREP